MNPKSNDFENCHIRILSNILCLDSFSPSDNFLFLIISLEAFDNFFDNFICKIDLQMSPQFLTIRIKIDNQLQKKIKILFAFEVVKVEIYFLLLGFLLWYQLSNMLPNQYFKIEFLSVKVCLFGFTNYRDFLQLFSVLSNEILSLKLQVW